MNLYRLFPLIISFIMLSSLFQVGSGINVSTNFINSDIFHISISPSRNETVDQQQTSHFDKGIPLINDTYAQSFRPEKEILTKVELLIGVEGNPPADTGITVSIGKNLYNPIKSVTIRNIGVENEKWVEFDMFFINIDIGHTYYIICSADKGDIENHYVWYFDVDDPYENGSTFISEDNGRSWDPYDPNFYHDIDFCFKTYGFSNVAPEIPIKPDGPTKGRYGKPYTYQTSTIDSDGDEIYYQWSWGDNNTTEWLGPYKPGDICEATHIWLIQGSYIVKVKAKDQWNVETDWSDPLIVKMEKSKLLDILMSFLHFYSILR